MGGDGFRQTDIAASALGRWTSRGALQIRLQLLCDIFLNGEHYSSHSSTRSDPPYISKKEWKERERDSPAHSSLRHLFCSEQRAIVGSTIFVCNSAPQNQRTPANGSYSWPWKEIPKLNTLFHSISKYYSTLKLQAETTKLILLEG